MKSEESGVRSREEAALRDEIAVKDAVIADLEKDYALVRHNLLKSNRPVAELEAYNQVLLESQGQFRADLQAARVEGLREARANVCVDCADRITRQIAALERGKE